MDTLEANSWNVAKDIGTDVAAEADGAKPSPPEPSDRPLWLDTDRELMALGLVYPSSLRSCLHRSLARPRDCVWFRSHKYVVFLFMFYFLFLLLFLLVMQVRHGHA